MLKGFWYSDFLWSVKNVGLRLNSVGFYFFDIIFGIYIYNNPFLGQDKSPACGAFQFIVKIFKALFGELEAA